MLYVKVRFFIYNKREKGYEKYIEIGIDGNNGYIGVFFDFLCCDHRC